MGRPRTPLGTAGRISTVGHVAGSEGRWVKAPEGTRPTRWRARTKHRDTDGVLRDVEVWAETKAKAETRLKAKLVDRQAPRTGDSMTPDTLFAAAAQQWLAQAERPDSGLAPATVAHSRYVVGAYVTGSRIAALTLQEVNAVAVLEGYVQHVADTNAAGAAKSAKSVVSGTLALAVRYGILNFNACRDVRPARASRHRDVDPTDTVRDISRAFTRAERDGVVALAKTHKPTEHLDVADFVAFMAGLGVRIGEARNQLWSDVDLDGGKVLIRGTKTSGSTRVVTLPDWLATTLRDRAERFGAEGVVFHSPGTSDRTKPRDQRNLMRAIRKILDAAGHPWATPHTFRRTVASLIDEAGESVALAADVLGHKDASMTARVYLGRRGDTSRAAAVL